MGTLMEGLGLLPTSSVFAVAAGLILLAGTKLEELADELGKITKARTDVRRNDFAGDLHLIAGDRDDRDGDSARECRHGGQQSRRCRPQPGQRGVEGSELIERFRRQLP
jgi:hypothetical protein